jgi:hypothetical protein
LLLLDRLQATFLDAATAKPTGRKGTANGVIPRTWIFGLKPTAFTALLGHVGNKRMSSVRAVIILFFWYMNTTKTLWEGLAVACQITDIKVEEIRAYFAAQEIMLCRRDSCCSCGIFAPYIHDNFGRRAPRLICRNETCIQCGDKKQDPDYKPYCGHDCEYKVCGKKGDY